jgi:hypothetical protein
LGNGGVDTAEDVFARTTGDRGESEGEEVFAIAGDAEVAVKGEEGVADAGKKARKGTALRVFFDCEGTKGTVGYNTMRVVAKDVVLGWVEGDGPMERHRKVVLVVFPDGQPSHEI